MRGISTLLNNFRGSRRILERQFLQVTQYLQSGKLAGLQGEQLEDTKKKLVAKIESIDLESWQAAEEKILSVLERVSSDLTALGGETLSSEKDSAKVPTRERAVRTVLDLLDAEMGSAVNEAARIFYPNWELYQHYMSEALSNFRSRSPVDVEISAAVQGHSSHRIDYESISRHAENFRLAIDWKSSGVKPSYGSQLESTLGGPSLEGSSLENLLERFRIECAKEPESAEFYTELLNYLTCSDCNASQSILRAHMWLLQRQMSTSVEAPGTDGSLLNAVSSSLLVAAVMLGTPSCAHCQSDFPSRSEGINSVNQGLYSGSKEDISDLDWLEEAKGVDGFNASCPSCLVRAFTRSRLPLVHRPFSVIKDPLEALDLHEVFNRQSRTSTDMTDSDEDMDKSSDLVEKPSEPSEQVSDPTEHRVAKESKRFVVSKSGKVLSEDFARRVQTYENVGALLGQRPRPETRRTPKAQRSNNRSPVNSLSLSALLAECKKPVNLPRVYI